MDELLIARRAFIAEMLLLIGASVSPSSAVAAIGASPAQAGSKARFLPPQDMARLREIAEAMIPKTDTPGAKDAGVPEFIDGLMFDWAGEAARAQLRRVLSDYAALTSSGGNSPQARVAAIEAWDRRSFAAPQDDAGADAYRWLKRLVFLAYRTSEAAFASYVPNPGKYRGNLSSAEYEALTAEHSVGRA